MRHAVLLGLALSFYPTFSANAQESTSYTYGDWKVTCVERENALPCEMTQSLIDSTSGQTVTHFSLAYSPVDEAYAIQISVPLGVKLEGGMVIKAGETVVEGIRFSRCLPGGCLIEAKLEDPLLGAMSAGGEAAIAVVDASGQAVSLPYSLNGFADAKAQLVKETTTRMPQN